MPFLAMLSMVKLIRFCILEKRLFLFLEKNIDSERFKITVAEEARKQLGGHAQIADDRINELRMQLPVKPAPSLIQAGQLIPVKASSLNTTRGSVAYLQELQLSQHVHFTRTLLHNGLTEEELDAYFYFDPPYYPISKSSNFTTYTKENFLERDQKRLAELFKRLDKKGVKVMLSNSSADFIKELYKGYIPKIVMATRMINCDAKGRGKINEIPFFDFAFYMLKIINIKLSTL